MKSLIAAFTIVIASSGVFCNQALAQGPATSSLYRSAARQGVKSAQDEAATHPHKQSERHSAAALRPDAPVPLGPLTGRGILTTYTVTTTDDTGPGSLRQAIVDANAAPGLDLIAFAIPASGVQSIRPASALPMITDSVIIDGASQPGYAGKPLIEIDGSAAGTGKNGLVVTAGGSTIRGLIINRFVANGIDNGMGIVLDQNGGNVIEGNYIGLNAAGEYPAGNGGSGVAIFGGSTGNLIGGTTAAKRNIISGNMMSGIQISSGSAGGNRVVNNYIGLNVTGDSARGNLGNGIYCDAPDNVIGDTLANSRNIISGNYMPGVALDPSASGTLIRGNYFGTDYSLWQDLGNSNNGIAVLGASNNVIGGPSIKARNSILSSDQAGIIISGPTATGNAVLGNYIGPANGNLTSSENRVGIWILNAPGNTIGGTADSSWNVITNNRVNGVEITGSAASGNAIYQNRIGGYYTTSTGYGNLSYGIAIDNAPGNFIGGIALSTGNYINGNHKGGIIIAGDTATGNIVRGNLIGPDLNGAKGLGVQADGIILAATGNVVGGLELLAGNTIMYNKRCGIYDSTGRKNAFLGNVIYANDSLGIDLAPRGITPNDNGDADIGANDLQNFPILDSAAMYPDSTRIRGRMSGVPGATYTLEFFKNSLHHPSHFGQGAELFGRGTVTCDGSGKGDINITVPAGVLMQQIISATATSPDSSTSEFSRELCMLDSDGDGIPDLWESPNDGIDWNCDGIIDLNLYDRGARKYHKDVFVEIDYMESAGDSLEPYAGAIADVEAAFRSAKNRYVGNPDGNDGINLIAEIDNSSPPVPNAAWLDPPWAEFDTIKAHHFGTKEERDDPNWANIYEAKKLVYRYCVFADQFGTSGTSGRAHWSNGINGDVVPDFMVSLGSWAPRGGTRDEQAGTFMHELGHTLGLRHGGFDDKLYKPNYYSIMNYLFQVPQNIQSPGSWRLNYSPVALMTQYENKLDELRGLNPDPDDYPDVLIPYNRPDNTIALAPLKPNTPVDWDGDGDSTNFASMPVDINFIDKGDKPSPGDTLYGYADWPAIKMNFRNSPVFTKKALMKAPADTTPGELDLKIRALIDSLPKFGVLKPLSSWSDNPSENIPVATDSATNQTLQIVSDGHGGAIMTWHHQEALYPAFGMSPNSGIFAQRIDSMGMLQWRNNGVMVKKGARPGATSSIIADGAGGAIIVWDDSTVTHGVFNVYAQRIDSYGRALWGNDGVAVSSNSTQTRQPFGALVSDQNGGAVVVWNSANDLYAQRIDGSGAKLWASGGVRVGPNDPSPYGNTGTLPGMQYDSLNGAVIVWSVRYPGANSSIYGQRIDPSGTVQWGINGKAVYSKNGVDAVGGWSVPAGDGSAIVVWNRPSPVSKFYAQKIDASGQILWGANGVPVDTSSIFKMFMKVVSDCSGGAIVTWYDNRRNISLNHDIYAQRIDSSGAAQWAPDGVFVTDSLYYPLYDCVSDNAGGAVFTFSASLPENNWRDDIYVQHVDSTGVATWPGNRTRICAAQKTQNYPAAVSDGAGGAVVAWLDYRRSNVPSAGLQSVYAQKVNLNGGLGDGLVTAVREGHPTLPAGFELLQNYPNPFNPTTTITFRLPVLSNVTVRVYNVLGQMVKELANGIENPGEYSVVWNAGSVSSGVYFYRLEATSATDPGRAFSQVKKMILLK